MSTIDLLNVVVCDLLALSFLVICIWKGMARRYIYLNLHSASLLISSGVRFLVRSSYGFQSTKYFYTFYISDLVLTVLLYMVILSVFETILRDSALRNQARGAFFVCFAIVAAMSYFAISNSLSNHVQRYVIELQQNMYFTSVVMTALLCVALTHLRVADPQLRVIVFGLGVYGGLHAAGYAWQNMLPKDTFLASFAIISRILPIATDLRLALWCAALIRVPALSEVTAGAEEASGNIAGDEAHALRPVLARAGGRG